MVCDQVAELPGKGLESGGDQTPREDEQEINRLFAKTLQGQDVRSCILQKKGQPR